MNKKKDCESARFLEEKQSDNKRLSVDAKILIALIHKQPLKRVDLIKRAGVHPSSFSRSQRLLLNNKGIKKTRNGCYCLYTFIEQTTLWEKVQKKCLDAGGPVIDLTLQKLVLGDQDPVTGHYETSYDDVIIQGIIIPRGADDLKKAASVDITAEYSAFVLTKDSLDEGDFVKWKYHAFEVKTQEKIYDGNNFSYWLIKLIQRY